MADPPTPVEQRLIAHGQRLDELEDTVKTLADTATGKRPLSNWKHQTLDAWVEGWFAERYARSIVGGTRWCSQWYEHPEAVTRLHALWTSWEVAQRDPDRGMIIWLRDGDAQFYELTRECGPFISCDYDGHRVLPALRCDQVPPGTGLVP
jgi:hypothetical protein